MLLLPAAPCKRAKIGLAILSRWHDRRFGWTGETLKIGIEDLLDRGYLPPPATVPMFAFRVSWDHVAMLRQSQKKNASARSEFGALNIRIIPGDTGNSDPTAKCGSSSTGRSPSRMDSALSARRGSPSTATWCPTTSIPVVWEVRGETIIRKTFKLSTGGATGKRDRAEGNAGALRYRRGQRPSKSQSFDHCSAMKDRADSEESVRGSSRCGPFPWSLATRQAFISSAGYARTRSIGRCEGSAGASHRS